MGVEMKRRYAVIKVEVVCPEDRIQICPGEKLEDIAENVRVHMIVHLRKMVRYSFEVEEVVYADVQDTAGSES